MSETISPQYLADEARKIYQRGDFLIAARSFEVARQGYQTQGDELAAAEMANNSSVAYLQAGDPHMALLAVEGSAAIFSAAGDLARQGMALGNRAAALEGLGQLDEALEGYEQSADVLRQAGDDPAYLHVMQALSALQLRMGRQLQALSTMQGGLESVKHPSLQQRLLKRMLGIPFRMVK